MFTLTKTSDSSNAPCDKGGSNQCWADITFFLYSPVLVIIIIIIIKSIVISFKDTIKKKLMLDPSPLISVG